MLKFWFPVLLYSAIIFGISALPNLQVPVAKPNADKVAHVLEHIPFGFLVLRALRKSFPKGSFFYLWLGAVVLVGAHGLLDEYHQSFVPGRESSWQDVMADMIGGMIGALLYLQRK